jgi:predicted ATPase
MVSGWHVITGAPCSGKTTLLELLGKMGYSTVPEAARIIVDEEIKKGRKNEEMKSDMLSFQRAVLEFKVRSESDMPRDKAIFFDRGIPDSIAYYKLYGYSTREVLKFCGEKRYANIFLLNRLPFQKDYARVENDEIAARIEKLLFEAYTELGYEVVRIPIMPIEERLKMILKIANPQ